jgi:hypothetical protein
LEVELSLRAGFAVDSACLLMRTVQVSSASLPQCEPAASSVELASLSDVQALFRTEHDNLCRCITQDVINQVFTMIDASIGERLKSQTEKFKKELRRISEEKEKGRHVHQ